MHDDGTDIVWMCFEGGDLFRGVVIVNAQLEVIGTADYPILARNKAAGSNGDIGKFKGFDNGLVVCQYQYLSCCQHEDIPGSHMTRCRRGLYRLGC